MCQPTTNANIRTGQGGGPSTFESAYLCIRKVLPLKFELPIRSSIAEDYCYQRRAAYSNAALIIDRRTPQCYLELLTAQRKTEPPAVQHAGFGIPEIIFARYRES
jgi:hypothetical protein